MRPIHTRGFLRTRLWAGWKNVLVGEKVLAGRPWGRRGGRWTRKHRQKKLKSSRVRIFRPQVEGNRRPFAPPHSCARLILGAAHAKLPEAWLSSYPPVLMMYVGQFLPLTLPPPTSNAPLPCCYLQRRATGFDTAHTITSTQFPPFPMCTGLVASQNSIDFGLALEVFDNFPF